MVGSVYKSALADEIVEIYGEMRRLKKDNKNN